MQSQKYPVAFGNCWRTCSCFTLRRKTSIDMSGPHFRDYHLLLDEHASQIFAMTDEIAERTRKNRRDDASFRLCCVKPTAGIFAISRPMEYCSSWLTTTL